MQFSKWHALGNAYLVLERAELGRPLEAQDARGLSEEEDTDGVIEVIAEYGAEADIQIWNPDGSQAEFSGNGARIAAAWLAERIGKPDVRLRFGGLEAGAHVHAQTVELEVGPVVVGEPEELDLAGERVTFLPVSVGNPHAVVRGDRGEIGRLGPQIENHPRFPKRTNVQLVEVLGQHELRIAIWERGAGETSASGSSSVAAAAAAVANGWCESPVIVEQPGGALVVKVHPDGSATLAGPVERLA
jgi:diaminopimelate epimerase